MKGKKREDTGKTAAEQALDFFAEAGLLKRIKRTGWWVAGIDDPESVAEHSFRTAVIGYYLAYWEDVDPFKVVTMSLFNDIHEARINDLHKMGHYYIDFKLAEQKVFKDQVAGLDARVKGALERMRAEYDKQMSPESLVARDADILECLIQAKEYYDNGYCAARLFFKSAPKFLRTKSARKLWGQIRRWDSSRWWQAVVKFER
ncbi:MAG TPA: HD domain-containing protein [Candidatus Omnitrophota bacterium]|nr:HD domain-containing protein [Candidatus Omnitrophota bacterium]HQO57266.1 HD domain-containing protein [Candidatus Omnitrophota bacterium]